MANSDRLSTRREAPLHSLAVDAARFHKSKINDVEQTVRPTGSQSSLSTVSTFSTSETIPDGGYYAWLQVAGSWVLCVNSWGFVATFGVFQTYYESNPYWTQSPSNISWIGSTQACLLPLVGIISGPLYDAGYFRHLLYFGTFCVTFGLMMTSLCREYWQTMLAQGIVVGVGMGCLFIPSVAIIPQYFSTRRSFATGIATTGGSFGGVVYPIVFRTLEQHVGFGWATRVMGIFAFVIQLFSICVMKQRVMPKATRQMVQLSSFKEMPYSLFNVSCFFAMAGCFIPLYYVTSFAITIQVTDASFGFYLLPILNAASTLGRIILPFLADFIGALNIFVAVSLGCSVLAFAWAGIHNISGIIAFCLLYGFASGALASMLAPATAALTQDMRYYGTRLGQTFFIGSFGLLIGAPIAGTIYSDTQKYLGLQMFSGAILVLAALFSWSARATEVGLKLKIKI